MFAKIRRPLVHSSVRRLTVVVHLVYKSGAVVRFQIPPSEQFAFFQHAHHHAWTFCQEADLVARRLTLASHKYESVSVIAGGWFQ